MQLPFGRILGGIHSQGPFMRSLQKAMSLEERDIETDLSHVHTYVDKGWNSGFFSSGIKSFNASAYVCCTNPYRTGFSVGNDRVRIFHVEGLETFDGAFGFLTEQVEQAKRVYKSSHFRYYPDQELNSTLSNISSIYEYDGLLKQWKPLYYIFYCPRCGIRVSSGGMVAAGCPKCNVDMVMKVQ